MSAYSFRRAVPFLSWCRSILLLCVSRWHPTLSLMVPPRATATYGCRSTGCLSAEETSGSSGSPSSGTPPSSPPCYTVPSPMSARYRCQPSFLPRRNIPGYTVCRSRDCPYIASSYGVSAVRYDEHVPSVRCRRSRRSRCSATACRPDASLRDRMPRRSLLPRRSMRCHSSSWHLYA